MIILKQFCIYRQDIQANRNILYLFDDNLERSGFEGQAAEARGEPNTFGIATKRAPGFELENHFHDAEGAIQVLHKEFEILSEVLYRSEYDGLVVPLNGIGTGLPKLHEYAPKALQFIEMQLKQIELQEGE